MIIAISGLAGSGKDSVARLLAEKLGVKHINFTFKDAAKSKGMTLLEYQEYARTNESVDREFDEMVLAESKKQDCVISTWIGAWIVKDADLKVWLDAGQETRARRLSGRDSLSLADAIDHIKKRDAQNRARYKRVYGIDIFADRGIFDMIINTERFKPEEIAEIICAAIEGKFVKE